MAIERIFSSAFGQMAITNQYRYGREIRYRRRAHKCLRSEYEIRFVSEQFQTQQWRRLITSQPKYLTYMKPESKQSFLHKN